MTEKSSTHPRPDPHLIPENEVVTAPDVGASKYGPGRDEGKTAMIEFELADLDFVEEQQTFDFGVEFKDAPPTAAMLDKGPFGEICEIVEPDDDQDVFLGDDAAQLDFDEAARAIAEEEKAAAEAAAIGRVADHTAIERSRGKIDREEVSSLAELPRLKVGTDDELMRAIQAIPAKMAFKIGEVAEMLGVKQYVLRYWESEFDALKPRKSKNGQRVYTRRDVETALMIRKLLYTDRFSIEGARGVLRQLKGRVREEKDWKQLLTNQDHVCESLRSLVVEIRRLRDTLT